MAFRLNVYYGKVCEGLKKEGDSGLISESQICDQIMRTMNIINPDKQREHLAIMEKMEFIERRRQGDFSLGCEEQPHIQMIDQRV